MTNTDNTPKQEAPRLSKSVAVLGLGYWGKNLVRNFHEIGALGMICDSDQDAVKRFEQLYPGVSSTSDYREVLSDKTIKGVVVSTPAETHCNIVQEAILAGKDVYVEKPLCLSEADGARLVNLARDEGCVLMVGHLLWYHPAVLKLKELISAGELGRIQYIYSNRLNLGKLRREENVLWSFAPHDISVIQGLVGEMPVSVQAQGGNFLHENIADTTVSMLSFSSGIRAHIFVSWLHPFKEQKLVVVGDRKMAVFEDTLPWQQKLQLYPHRIEWSENLPVAQKGEGESVALTEGEPLRAECEHFLECVETRARPRTDGTEGIRVLKVLNACQEALESGASVFVERRQRPQKEYQAHESAIIDEGVHVGTGSKIWHFSHIIKGSTIGDNCNIGQNVVIGPNAIIGNGCKIQNNVSVYEGVTLEDGVFCGPSMVFTNVNNPRSEVPRKDQYRATRVGKGATMGANCTVVCGNQIGRYAFVGAGAVVTQNVKDHSLVIGNPARHDGWICACGERLPENLECVSCNNKYVEKTSGLEAI